MGGMRRKGRDDGTRQSGEAKAPVDVRCRARGRRFANDGLVHRQQRPQHQYSAAETRERVWAAVEELGWRPNAMARSLSLQRSHTIGLISDEVATSPHAGKIIQGAQDAAWDDSKMLLVINTGGKPAIESAALEMMLERRVEGIIYATMYHHAVTPPPELAYVPTVLLDCFVDDRSLPSVVPDEVQGGRTAAELLLARGHRRIGFINDVGPNSGIVRAARRLPAGAGVVWRAFRRDTGTQWSKYRFGRATGVRWSLLQLPQRPTALFCFNDSMAMGVYEAARKLGLRIPDRYRDRRF